MHRSSKSVLPQKKLQGRDIFPHSLDVVRISSLCCYHGNSTMDYDFLLVKPFFLSQLKRTVLLDLIKSKQFFSKLSNKNNFFAIYFLVDFQHVISSQGVTAFTFTLHIFFDKAGASHPNKMLGNCFPPTFQK